MDIIVTEKPSVAREYAKILKINQKENKEGYIEGKGQDGKDYRITWAIGHLITMSYPEVYGEEFKKWRLDTLPFLPERYKYEVIKDVVKQYKVIKALYHMNDVDAIYYAGDSAREGIYIQMLIRMIAGHKNGIEEKVVWIDSQTEDEIKRGLREAKPISAYQNLIDAAFMRAIEDYAIGINFSRALSCKFGYSFNKKIRSEKQKPISIGRVMTCVLGMIVLREREIRNFKETLFYKPIAQANSIKYEWKAIENTTYYNSPQIYDNKGFLSEEEAQNFINTLSQNPELKVIKADIKQEKKYAPLLFNLAELQAESTRILKLSPQETLDIVQSLYEKKMVTYPRTDARVLSSAISKEINKTLSGLSNGSFLSEEANNILSKGAYKGLEKTKYCDDKKISDHYALIPTGEGDYTELKGSYKEIYEMIVKRFLSIFYPPAEYKKADIELLHQKNEHFFASDKVLKTPGYLVLYGEKSEEDTEIMALKINDVINPEYSIAEGKTTPPKRYTSGSMILAMENAGNLIEEEELREQIKSSGIGTSATRAEIINKLIKNGYITLNKKTQILSPLDAGEIIVEIVEDNIPALLSPKMTASWELGLSQIEEGKVSRKTYEEKLNAYITKEVDNIKNKKSESRPDFKEETLPLHCPWCGGDIVTTPLGYKCVNYSKEKDGCGFYVGQIAKRQISKDELSELIINGETQVLQGFQGKKGTFEAKVVIDREEKKLKFAFPESNEEDTGLICPWCSGKVMATKFGYKCENNRKDDDYCDFFVNEIGHHKVTHEELKELLTKGKTDIIKFTGKKGPYEAKLCLDNGEKKIKMEFAEYKDIATNFICPKCGEKMSKTPYKLKCTCGFETSHFIANKQLTDSQVNELLSGKTSLIEGFKSKAGKKFNAYVVMDEHGNTSFEFSKN